jgi:hypothetical protein
VEQAAITTATVNFLGETLTLESLDLGDIITLKKEVGGLWNLDATDPEHQLLLLWLTLRRVDPRLTPEQKAKREYLMTQEEVAQRVPFRFLTADNGFFATVMELAGFHLLGNDAEEEADVAEPDQGNAPAPEVAPVPKRKPKEKTATG